MARPIPYGGPSQPYDHRSNIPELLLRQGNIAADRAERQGAILGNAVAGIGKTVGEAVEQSARSRAVDKLFAGPEPPNPKDIIRVFGPVEGPKVIQGLNAISPNPSKQYNDRMERLRDAARGVKALPEDKRAAGWDFAAQGLLHARVLTPEEVTPYNPDTLDQLASYGVEPAKAQGLMNVAPGGTLVDPVTKRPVYTAPPTEPKPPAPPAVGSFEDFVVTKFGPRPTAGQITQARKEYNQADDRPLQINNPEAKAQRERLVSAVIANPSLWDDLTPGVKGDIAAELNSKGFSGFGKRMSDGTLKQISESKSAVASLRDLRTTLQENEQFIGPVAGLAALNPYSDARKAQSKIDLVRQRVGKALEGGVLRKEDEEKYKKILATLQDTPETAIFKVDQLIQTLENDMNTFIEEQRSAGRRVAQPSNAPPATPAGKGGPKRINTDSEYNALPSGAEFIAPDGSKRRKP